MSNLEALLLLNCLIAFKNPLWLPHSPLTSWHLPEGLSLDAESSHVLVWVSIILSFKSEENLPETNHQRSPQKKLVYGPEISTPNWTGFYSFLSHHRCHLLRKNRLHECPPVHPQLNTKLTCPSFLFVVLCSIQTWIHSHTQAVSHTGPCIQTAINVFDGSFTYLSADQTAPSVISSPANHWIWAGTRLARNLKDHRQQREHSLLPSSARASCPGSTMQNRSKNDPRWPPGKMEVPLYTCCTCGSNAAELLDRVNAQIRCWRRSVFWRMFPLMCYTKDTATTAYVQPWFGFVSRVSLEMWRWKWGLDWTAGAPSFGPTFPAVLLKFPVKAPSHQISASHCWKWKQLWASPSSVEISHDSH